MVSNNKIVTWVPARTTSKEMLRQQPRGMVSDQDLAETSQVSFKDLNSECLYRNPAEAEGNGYTGASRPDCRISIVFA
jgi:hypothetical protein